jgi:hypothetical protein
MFCAALKDPPNLLQSRHCKNVSPFCGPPTGSGCMKSSREIIKRVHSRTQTHSSHQWATQVLYNDFYVDLLSGASTLGEAMHLQ